MGMVLCVLECELPMRDAAATDMLYWRTVNKNHSQQIGMLLRPRLSAQDMPQA